jgi:hypothetical protein
MGSLIKANIYSPEVSRWNLLVPSTYTLNKMKGRRKNRSFLGVGYLYPHMKIAE